MRNVKKMRGVIEPYTLGFLLSLIGSLTSYLIHKDDSPYTDEKNTAAISTEIVDIVPGESRANEENL